MRGFALVSLATCAAVAGCCRPCCAPLRSAPAVAAAGTAHAPAEATPSRPPPSDPVGDRRLALALAHQAANGVASMAAGLEDAQAARLRSQHADVFASGATAAALLGDAPEVVYFLEAGRAGALLASIAGADALRAAATPEALQGAEVAAAAAVAAAERTARGEAAAGRAPAARAAREARDAARSRLVEAVERRERAALRAANLVAPRPVPSAAIRAPLADGDVLVLYGVFAQTAMAAVLTRESERVVTLGPTAAIEEASAEVVPLDPGTDVARSFARLRSLVVDPLGLPPTTRRLLVSPDGPLHRVPFAALVDHVAVAVVPSGTALELLAERGALRGDGVLAIAASASVPAGEGRDGPRPSLGSVAEVEAVGSVVRTGADATEPALRAALGARARWRALHLASPVEVDDRQPALCAVALAADADDDGRLHAYEVVRTVVAADLVVLSACESARGPIVPGEGMMGLPRAFLRAGAPRVIASLGLVDDAATSALMTKFYELWNPKTGSTGMGTAEALRAAQEHVRSQEKWKHPYYWAAWVLWGLPS